MAKAKQKPLTLDEILSILQAHLPELRKRYYVKSLGVFGSYVRGEHRKRSDLDVLVEFDESPSLLKLIEMENYLSDLFGVKVDLVPRKNLKPYIGKRILSEVVWLIGGNGGSTVAEPEQKYGSDRGRHKMPREYLDFLEDIVKAMAKVERFVAGLALEQLLDDERTLFAITHAIEIIGEAAKRIPQDIRRKYPDIPWKEMAGMRDKLAHGYFEIDNDKLWETATRLIPEVKSRIVEVLELEIENRRKKQQND